MLKAKISKSKLLAIESVAFLDEANIKIANEGIKIYGINPSKTIMSNLSIGKDEFRDYKINPHEFLATLKVSDLLDVVRRITADTIELEIDSNIRIMGTNGDREQYFILPLLNTGEENKDVVIDFKKAIEFNSLDLRNTIKDMSLINESLSIGIGKNDETIIKCNSKEGKAVAVNIKPTKAGLMAYAVGESCSSNFTNELMITALKGLRISRKVNVFVGEDCPMKMQFINNKIELNTIIANRCDDEETSKKVNPQAQEVKVEVENAENETGNKELEETSE